MLVRFINQLSSLVKIKDNSLSCDIFMQCTEIVFITSIWYVPIFISLYSIGTKSNRLINISLLLLNYMQQEALKLFCCVCFKPAFHFVNLSSLTSGYNKMLDKMIAKRGQYFSECDDNLGPGVWQEQFWGDSYPRLLEIKRKYDPDNHFTCKQCVGSTANAVGSTSIMVLVSYLLVFNH
mgnify:CR=1 FL=1